MLPGEGRISVWDTWNVWSYVGSATLRLHDLGQVLSVQALADSSVKEGLPSMSSFSDSALLL